MNAVLDAKFFCAALIAAVGCFVTLGETARAEETPSPVVAVVERVIVTGSAIPTAEEVGTNPVFSINRDLINKSGAGTTAEQLLQRLPVMNGATIPVQNNATGGAGPAGTAALALRGLDPRAPPVLVYSPPLAPVPGGAHSPDRFVVPTTLPI